MSANLIDTLLVENLITREQLSDAKDKKLGAKKPLHELLVDMGFVKEEDLMRVISQLARMSVTDLSKERVDTEAVKLLTYEQVKRYGVLPVRIERDTLILAMSYPQDLLTQDDIRALTKRPIKPILSTKSQISEFIEVHYQLDDSVYDILKRVQEDLLSTVASAKDLSETGCCVDAFNGDRSPIVRIINMVLSDAIKARASDIHMEPQESCVEVRYRIDGDLKSIMKLPASLHPQLSSRIKILADLDIAERKKPQDGRVRICAEGRSIDFRISTVPTFFGETVVLRLLDLKEACVELNKIGMKPHELDILRQAIATPQGMILVTGPTGSGKTSTLYGALNHMKSETRNIVTVEDPIEFLFEGINQIQVNPVKGVTFSTCLKSVLRQDPNIILVGEIRDKETADTAFQASLTGHLVFSTLHTNNAISTLTRLTDLGLEPYLIASSLVLIVAQRLVKLTCVQCKETYDPDPKLLEAYAGHLARLNIKKFYRGRGCEACRFTGFHGRTAIFEMLRISQKIRNMVAERSSEGPLYEEAQREGFKTLFEAGMERVADGSTTLEELLKIANQGIAEGAGHDTHKGTAARVLIADDEKDILKLLHKRLSDAGYEVIEAENGKEALNQTIRHRPDLVITDVGMPVMNGFELTRALRGRLETATIPIMMLTAKSETESELEGLDAGADDYLTKPYVTEKMLARIRMLLRRTSSKKGN